MGKNCPWFYSPHPPALTLFDLGHPQPPRLHWGGDGEQQTAGEGQPSVCICSNQVLRRGPGRNLLWRKWICSSWYVWSTISKKSLGFTCMLRGYGAKNYMMGQDPLDKAAARPHLVKCSCSFWFLSFSCTRLLSLCAIQMAWQKFPPPRVGATPGRGLTCRFNLYPP